jgi:hypothetical protein
MAGTYRPVSAATGAASGVERGGDGWRRHGRDPNLRAMASPTPASRAGSAGRDVRRAVTAGTVVLSVAAIVKELRTPRRKRRWHGRIAGVPYDFRRPTVDRLRHNLWNPRRKQVLVPRTFGVGWEVNLGRLWRLVRRR